MSWLLRLDVLFGGRIVSACLWSGSQVITLKSILKISWQEKQLLVTREISSNIDVEVKGQAEKQQNWEAEPTGCHKWSFGKIYASFTVSAQAIQLVIRHCIKKTPKDLNNKHTQQPQTKRPRFWKTAFFSFCPVLVKWMYWSVLLRNLIKYWQILFFQAFLSHTAATVGMEVVKVLWRLYYFIRFLRVLLMLGSYSWLQRPKLVGICTNRICTTCKPGASGQSQQPNLLNQRWRSHCLPARQPENICIFKWASKAGCLPFQKQPLILFMTPWLTGICIPDEAQKSSQLQEICRKLQQVICSLDFPLSDCGSARHVGKPSCCPSFVCHGVISHSFLMKS